MLNLIVAPASHNAVAEKLTKKVVKYLKAGKVEYSVYFSQDFDNLKDNVETNISFGENEFVVIGDDVVISEFLNSVKDVSKLKFGIIPTSKNDDFARYIGLQTNPIEAIKIILAKNIETIDVMLVNNKKVINNVRIGASVNTYEAYNEYKIKNLISKQIATAKYGNTFEGIELSLETKGSKPKKEHIFELVVANGGNSKGKQISPLANVEDGWFNVSYSVVSAGIDKKKTVKLFNDGEHIYEEKTKQLWLNNLKITNADKKIKAMIDGKICNLESLDITIVEKGLKIYK